MEPLNSSVFRQSVKCANLPDRLAQPAALTVDGGGKPCIVVDCQLEHYLNNIVRSCWFTAIDGYRGQELRPANRAGAAHAGCWLPDLSEVQYLGTSLQPVPAAIPRTPIQLLQVQSDDDV